MPGHRPRALRSSLPLLVALAIALVGILVPAGARPVHAADDFLRLSADATYRVDTDDGLVRVRIDWDATNLQPNSVRRTPTGTVTTRYYFDHIFFSVPREARSVSATSGGTRLTTSSRARTRFREVTVRFPQLFYRQSRSIRVEFTLPGGKPRSTSDVRVGSAFTTFTAWAWGDAGRGTVRIVLPRGFDDSGYGNDVTQRTHPDRVELTTDQVADSTEWYRVVVADRPSALTDVRLEAGGRSVVVQAWPEDKAWRERVSTVLEDGLPVLEELIGLPWPLSGELRISEVHTPRLEGYAGFYDPSTDDITMSEDLDDQTILHETSHAWFNGALVLDRWIDEGLAEHFADRARQELGLTGGSGPVEIEPDADGSFPLNEWPAPARIDDPDTTAQELFGYGAAYTVIRAIAEDIGDDGMRAVLAAMEAKHNAYRGDGAPETTGAAMDWRRFLDVAEEVGESDSVDDLFTRWVVPADERGDLRTRAEARDTYAELDAAGAEWAVPRGIRAQMALWRFEDATSLMALAAPIVAARDELAAATTDLGLAAPDDLETAFESALADEALADVGDTIEERIAAADAIGDARDALASERTPLVGLGLVGEIPDAGYVAARSAFETGDVAAATAASASTMALLAGAETAGTTRAIVLGIVIVGVPLLLVALAIVVRRRRRRLALGAAPADASTTLAATSEPAGARPEAPSTPIERAPGAEPD